MENWTIEKHATHHILYPLMLALFNFFSSSKRNCVTKYLGYQSAIITKCHNYKALNCPV